MTPDDNIRLAAFDWLHEQTTIHGDSLPRTLLEQGFTYHGNCITLLGARGIWKPKVMKLPLSITTVPNSRYDDGAFSDGSWQYKYRGTDPYHPDNVGLREVMRQKKPLIYFFGIIPGGTGLTETGWRSGLMHSRKWGNFLPVVDGTNRTSLIKQPITHEILPRRYRS